MGQMMAKKPYENIPTSVSMHNSRDISEQLKEANRELAKAEKLINGI